MSEFPFLYRFTVLLNSGGSNSPWSEFWSEFPHFMGMGVVPAPSILRRRVVARPPLVCTPISDGATANVTWEFVMRRIFLNLVFFLYVFAFFVCHFFLRCLSHFFIFLPSFPLEESK